MALAIVHQQAEAGKDLTKLLGDLLAFFRNLLIFKIDPQSLREEISDQARVSLEELAAGRRDKATPPFDRRDFGGRSHD